MTIHLSDRDREIVESSVTSDRKNFIQVFLCETPGVADFDQASGWATLSEWISRIKAGNGAKFDNGLWWGDLYDQFSVFWSEQNSTPVIAVAGTVKTLELGDNRVGVFEEKFLAKAPNASKTMSAREMYGRILDIERDVGVLKVASDDAISQDNFDRVWDTLSRTHDVYVYDTNTSALMKIDAHNPASKYWGAGKDHYKFLLTKKHGSLLECVFEIRRARLLIGNN